MSDKSVYDPVTGKILYWTSDEQMAMYNDASPAIEGHHPSYRYYLVDGQLQPRPAQSTQLFGLTLTALPANATLHIDGQAYPLTDTTVELDFPLPGTYQLRVECWPYLDWTTEAAA